MRIAFVADRVAPLYPGGYEERLWGFARRLAALGHDVSILTTCPEPHVRDGVRFVSISRSERTYFSPTGFRRLGDNVAFCWDLLRFAVNAPRFDVVDANATPWLHLPIALLLSWRARAHFVVTAHEALRESMRRYFKAKRAPMAGLQSLLAEHFYLASQRLGEALIASSPNVVDSLMREGFGKRVFAAPPGQDQVPRDQINFCAREPMRVVFVGRHVPSKRIDVLLEAACRMRTVQFSLLGDGPNSAELRAKAKAAALENVVFRGYLDEEEKRAELLSSDVFVMPSYREGWSLATVEAMAHGCAPVFALCPDRNETGIVGYVRHGENGLSFDGTADDLVRALFYLQNNPTETSRLRSAAHLTSLQFSWDAAVLRLLSIYDTVSNRESRALQREHV